jgi:hypothetical protein
MPIIPELRAQRDAVFNITTPNVVGEVYGAGAALKDVGRVLDNGADLIQQYAESQEIAKATKDLADTYGKWDAHLQDKKTNAEPGAPNFTPDILKEYDEYAKRTVEGFSTPRARQLMDEKLSNYRLSLQSDSLNYQAAAGLQYKVDTATQATRVAANTLISNPALLDQSLENVTIAIDNIGLPASKKGEFLQRARATLVESAVGGLAEKNPQQALKNLNDGLYDTQIDPNTKASLIARAQSRIDLGREEQRYTVKKTLTDYNALVEAGNAPKQLPAAISNEAIKNAYPEDPEVAQSLIDDRDINSEVAVITGELPRVKASTRANMIKEIQNQLNSPEVQNAASRLAAYSKAAQFAANFEKALDKNPASTVLQYNESVQNERSYLTDDKPDEPVIFQNYAKKTIAAQKLLGVPDNKLQVLDEQLLGGVTAELQAAKDGRSLTNILETQAAQWGEYWPIAVRQIGKELEPGYQTVIGTSEKENVNSLIGRLASDKAYVFPRQDIATALKQLPANKNTVPATDQKVIKDAVQGDAGDLKVFMDSIPSSFEAANIRDDTQAAISAYALFLRAQKGVDASTAASQAIVGVINSRYALVNTDEIKARVPRNVSEKLSATSVEKGAEILKQTVPNLKLNIPKDTDEAEFFEELVNSGTWKTSSGDEGLVLIDATDSPVFYAELDADGRPRPVQFTWAQIAEQAKKGEAELVKRRGELEKMKQKIETAPSTDPQVDRFGMPL